jgi:hypothetical protein
MCFTHFLLCKKKPFQELLNELLKKKKDQIRLIEGKLKNILSDLIPLQVKSLISLQMKIEYEKQVSEKTSELLQQVTRLNEQIAFIESLIQKLALSSVEITGDEQTFLIRLFLASKLSDPDSMVSILDGYLKNIGLMWNTILLSLYRYNRVHFWLQRFVVRVFLFQKGIEKEFYERAYFGFVTFDVKSEKEEKYNKLMKELIDDAKKKSSQYRDTFQSTISALEFEQLKSDFIECSAQFAKLISDFSSIDDFIFDGEKDLNSLNLLLDSLLAFESKFLSEKEKFSVFDREFDKFQKETENTLEAIFGMDKDSDTSHFGDSQELWRNYKYDQPFADIKALIETTKGVLFKKCQKDCDCQPITNPYDPRIGRDRRHQIVHKPVVLTPEMEKQICDVSANLQKLLE